MRIIDLIIISLLLIVTTATVAQDNQPPVQVLVPGFDVVELPVRLPNLNNLRYRPDGGLYALGYNGNVWLLRDTDGDGFEDASEIFFENQTQLRGPIGMAVLPHGHVLLRADGVELPNAQGVLVASKGKVSALLDLDGDGRAEEERLVASGWQEIPQNVDAVGVAIHPEDGSIYFGLGTAAFNNAFLLDEHGEAHFDLDSVRGTIQRVSPDLAKRETVCTGVRFTIGMQFDPQCELFVTDQEGATWLANGNPFDELLHIRQGRHYGFPPRHPRYLPRVFDEPSVYDYRPQHQSTCGFLFNVASTPETRTFGPASWIGDAFVTGQSRGKLYRTRLIRTSSGEYLASNQIFACLSMLTVDCTLTPQGNLLVCCHSGGPDWGTGPSGEGKLFLIRTLEGITPRPTAVWSSGSQEVRIAFDHPIDPTRFEGLSNKLQISAGPYVSAGDRFELLRPGYDVVQRQFASASRSIPVYSASVTSDRRTLVVATGPQTEAVQYAIQFSAPNRDTQESDRAASARETPIDLDYSLAGVFASWTADSPKQSVAPESTTASWSGVVPHPDPDLGLALWTDVPDARRYAQITEQPGTLILAMRVDTSGLFTPTVQPGSELDYQRSDDQWIVGRRLRLRSSQAMEVMWEGTTFWSSEADGEHRVELDCGDVEQKLPRLQVTLSTAKTPITFHVEWVAVFADGMSRVGPLSLARLLVPWASRQAATVPESGARTIPELAEANWGRGFKIFRHKDVACIQCHVAHGEGGDIGPDLSNLVHRDYTSVMRDVRHPGFAINPDYITYVVQTKAGRVLSGVVRSDGENLRVGDAEGRVTTLRHDEIEAIEPSPKSVMPEGLVDKLDAGQLNDLLAYLLLPAPRMSRAPDQPAAVAHYTRDEIAKRIIPLSTDAPPSNPLHLLLVAGAKDHGPNEHDYPAWLRTWSQLLSAADNITVDTAMEWPTAAQMERADTIVIYQRGDWSMDRAAMIDRHLTRGGGLVLIHWAIEGGDAAGEFARRIGFASNQTLTKYRHGPLEIHWAVAGEHPIARNLGTMQLHDESYWGLVGDATQVSVLARGAAEEGAIRPPLFWTVEPQAGRVFVSIPGHYSWTFDDPLFRLVLLRGIAWASREPVDRLAPLVYLGAKPPTPH